MKKSAFLLSLGLAVALSMAFYQRTDGPALRHLLMVVRYEHTPTSGGIVSASINLVGADGAPRAQNFSPRGTRQQQLNVLHQAEAAKLDSLSLDGWTLAQTWTNSTIAGVVETTHALTLAR